MGIISDWRIEIRKEQLRNQIALTELGFDTDLITDEQAVSDLIGIIDLVCPCMRLFADDIWSAKVCMVFNPPTKGGKIPKCPVRADIDGGDLICHTGYLADGRPYTADIYGWRDGVCHAVKIRNVSGELRIVEAARKHLDTDTWTILYKDSISVSNEDGYRALERSVNRYVEVIG